ncbi:unnamed protein product [Paramecium sonneborni]|uniref:Uncharacterized protein n=1 Tax=Paramecium sonneborni TaxID=65129 RepID=A0A8S1P111_9CILI|nr:unnamed protein product [Paramecium sonneborni]
MYLEFDDQMDYFKIPGPQAYNILSYSKHSTPSYKFGKEEKFYVLKNLITPSPGKYVFPSNFNQENNKGMRFGKDKKNKQTFSTVPGVGSYNLFVDLKNRNGIIFGRKLQKIPQKMQKNGKSNSVFVYYPFTNYYQMGKWIENDQDDGDSFRKLELYQQQFLSKDLLEKKSGIWIEFKKIDQCEVMFKGEYQKGNRIGRWRYYWKKNVNQPFELIFGGQYDGEQNSKNGKWVELSDDFIHNITFFGEYKNGKKIGRWDICYHGEKIGGGQYDQERNQKNGQWIELCDKFNEQNQVTFRGEYKNDQKIGRWDVYYFGEQIAGGEYDSEQNLKDGNWIELWDVFNEECQVTFRGEYKKDKKIGRWDIYYFTEQIAGGEYDQENIKNGKWIELINVLKNQYQVTFIGEYKNGKKIGQWDIYHFKQQIGGGFYDVEQSYKKGKWIELSDRFNDQCQITFSGQYKKDKKIGIWDTFYFGEKLGGGSYDDEQSYKKGKWIELSDRFNDQTQIIMKGEYHSGQKMDRWDIYLRDPYDNEKFELIGGGQYVDGSQKIGNWIDLGDGFCYSNQVTYHGQYKNGQKILRWEIYFRSFTNQKFQKIGGGEYSEELKNQKHGNWVELIEQIDGFYNMSQVTFSGEYKIGNKVGIWNFNWRERENSRFERIGGGYYDEELQNLKKGKWIELTDRFYDMNKVTHEGEYKNGKKIGRWDIFYQNKSIGGGSYYNIQGFNGVVVSIKNGKWVELLDQFNCNRQVTLIGEYQNGKKIGRWDIVFGQKQLIGGGSYEQNQDFNIFARSIKTGIWIELSDDFYNNSQVTFQGEYQKGKKVGKWDINLNQNGVIQQIGGGLYDDKQKVDGVVGSIKIGRWSELCKNFGRACDEQSIIYIGEYQNGKKVGKWKEMDFYENQFVKEINYDF